MIAALRSQGTFPARVCWWRMGKEPVTPPTPKPAEPKKPEPSRPPPEEPGKPYPVEKPPSPHPNEDRPLVDPVPPDKDLPRM